jgi:hypothetical protein
MSKRIAVIGDPHACIQELQELYAKLSWESLDEIWSAGDNIHRGPDDFGTVDFIRRKFTGSVLGNHEETFLKQWEVYKRDGYLPQKPDKAKTILALTDVEVNWIKSLPRFHIDDGMGLVIVHAGLFPGINFYQQPPNVVRASMIHPRRGWESRWWGPDAARQKNGKTEEESYAEGWRRWYELWDHKYRVVFGHAVFKEPQVFQPLKLDAGYVVAVDTGGCFGGNLTAAIFEDEKPPRFHSVPAKEVWFADGKRAFQDRESEPGKNPQSGRGRGRRA